MSRNFWAALWKRLQSLFGRGQEAVTAKPGEPSQVYARLRTSLQNLFGVEGKNQNRGERLRQWFRLEEARMLVIISWDGQAQTFILEIMRLGKFCSGTPTSRQLVQDALNVYKRATQGYERELRVRAISVAVDTPVSVVCTLLFGDDN